MYIIAADTIVNPLEHAYRIQYIILHVFPPPEIPIFFTYMLWFDKSLYESIACVHVSIANFYSKKLSSDWLIFFLKKQLHPNSKVSLKKQLLIHLLIAYCIE